MKYDVKDSEDIALNLAHAKGVISACRAAIPRIEVSVEDETFIRLRIMRMISELETIDRFVSKTGVTVRPRRTNGKNQADRDRASSGVHMGRHSDVDHTASRNIHAATGEPRDDATFRKLA